jgi:hypothetical protein
MESIVRGEAGHGSRSIPGGPEARIDGFPYACLHAQAIRRRSSSDRGAHLHDARFRAAVRLFAMLSSRAHPRAGALVTTGRPGSGETVVHCDCHIHIHIHIHVYVYVFVRGRRAAARREDSG